MKYLSVKIKINRILEPFYLDEIRRKIRLLRFSLRQKSESNFINKFILKFGKPGKVIVAFGDHSNGGHHRKHSPPVKGAGFRKMFKRAGFQVFLVDEFRTSCRCNTCHGETEKFRRRRNRVRRTQYQKEMQIYRKNILVHGLLRCKSKKECGRLWNRDVNGSLNIRMLAILALSKKDRPEAFKRQSNIH
jgi:hypothetical protein